MRRDFSAHFEFLDDALRSRLFACRPRLGLVLTFGCKNSTNASLFDNVTELLCRGFYVATQCPVDAIVRCTIS